MAINLLTSVTRLNSSFFDKNTVNNTNNVSFGKVPLFVKKNQLRILLTQDIWAPSLSVKLPESNLEKQVLIEVLNKRKRLDKFAKLTNKRFTLNHKAIDLQEKIRSNPDNPNIKTMRGNLAAYTKMLDQADETIALEAIKNREEYNYFKNLANIEQKYSDKRIVKDKMIEAFWNKVKENNINKDCKYSTRDLLEIISSYQVPKKSSN